MTSIPKFTWWQIALIALVTSAIGGLSSGRSKIKERKLYDTQLQQAPWAPPGWLFGPAWTFNNFFLLMALHRILHSNMPDRRKLLVLQAIIWIIFFSFGYVYFNRKSAILAAIWTLGDAVVAASSFVIAKRSDNKLALDYLPLLIWTSFASSLAVYQALYNEDPVLHTEPLLK